MGIRELREVDQLKPLIEYLQKNLKKGYKLEDLKWALVNQGHSRVAIDKATKFVEEIREAQKPKEAPKQEVPMPFVHTEERKGFWGKLKAIFGR